MDGLLKLLFFIFFFLVTAFLIYRSYRWMNGKIRGSSSGWQLLGYVLLMILLNAGFFYGGIFIFLKLYVLLTES